ncbi:uncharacterized protein LOC108230606 isoform X2 [Kryptolebias marmoratus]|uniref:uncharacterized protein LOC108230606 isoform X2 n=1 Tax=Kryptolebias marmoratus TaxID=37003 RepID=UPI0007F89BF8|nr:uncharacterized protein LOC108230606 isoform X2 [Kryptolebias marmoratus]
METWWKRTILLFLTVTGAAMAMPKEHHVYLDGTQKTKTSVVSGSSLILHCCLNTSGTDRCQVSWIFRTSGPNRTQIKSEQICKFTEKLKSNSSDTCFTNTCNISNINKTNSGYYSCNITKEIPILMNIISKETEVVVIAEREEDWMWMWILVGVSALILLVLLIICAVQRSRCRRSTEMDPIYVNTRPKVNKQPSPKPGLLGNNVKTVPSFRDATPSAARRYEEGKRRYQH